MKNIVNIQKLATFLRDAAYADNQSHGIEWRLAIVHPVTSDGVIGYSGGMWYRDRESHVEDVSVSFSYDSIKGISNFHLWKDKIEVNFSFGNKPSFVEFKETIINAYSLKELYNPKEKLQKRQSLYDQMRKKDIWTDGFFLASERNGSAIEITPSMLSEIYRQMKIQDGKNIVAVYSEKEFSDEEYIAVKEALDDIQSADSGDDEYQACIKALGADFEG